LVVRLHDAVPDGFEHLFSLVLHLLQIDLQMHICQFEITLIATEVLLCVLLAQTPLKRAVVAASAAAHAAVVRTEHQAKLFTAQLAIVGRVERVLRLRYVL